MFVLLRHQKENCAGFPFQGTRKLSDIKDSFFIMPNPPLNIIGLKLERKTQKGKDGKS